MKLSMKHLMPCEDLDPDHSFKKGTCGVVRLHRVLDSLAISRVPSGCTRTAQEVGTP